MKTNNVIPRQFIKITGKMLVNTNMDNIGDTVSVYKNNFGYLELNHRTGKYAYAFVSMLRNAQVFELLEVEK